MPDNADSYSNGMEEITVAIAHEIKNPLALALANIEMIKSMDMEGKYLNSCVAAEKELYKVNELVQYILDGVCFEGMNDIVFICDLIDDILSDYEAINTKNILFGVHYKNTELTVPGNEKRLGIVFSNIIKNAVEACSSNGIISLSIYENDCGAIAVEITDNGEGIDKEALDKISAGGYTTKKNGSGAGLTICRSIIARHSGELKITALAPPERGGGCKVTVTLPKG